MKDIKTLVITVVFAALAITGVLSGCSANPAESKVVAEEPSMFVVLESTAIWQVVYHRETKVMYTVSSGYYNMGTFTLLVNPDGTPMLYEEENDG